MNKQSINLQSVELLPCSLLLNQKIVVRCITDPALLLSGFCIFLRIVEPVLKNISSHRTEDGLYYGPYKIDPRNPHSESCLSYLDYRKTDTAA